MNPHLMSTEDIETRLLDHTASLHAQTDSEERLLHLFRKQDKHLRQHGRARACTCVGLAAAACLTFGFIVVQSVHVFLPAMPTAARPEASLSACPVPCTTDEAIDTEIPQGTIDDIMRQALENTL